jgi:signal transduction histidine kinase
MFMVVGGLFISFVALACCFVILLSRPVNWIKFVWGMFCFSVAAWGYCLFRGHLTTESFESLFWFRIANLSAAFIALSFVHFCFLMTNEWQKQKRTLFFYTFWALLVLLGALLEPGLFIRDVRPMVGLAAYPVVGPVFSFYVVFFFSSYIRALVSLFFAYRKMPSLRRQQFRYIYFSFLFAFLWGGSAFLPMYGIPIPPYGIFLVPIFLLVVTWITIRYQLVDVRLFVSRAILSFFVYLFVLGLPLGLAFIGRPLCERILGAGWWMIPFFLLFFLATTAPFISLYFFRQTEAKALRDRSAYQGALLQAAYRMNQVKDVKFLSSLMVHVLTYSVKVEKAALYVLHDDGFLLAAHRERRQGKGRVERVGEKSFLMQYLNKNMVPIVADEVLLRGRDYNDKFLISLSKELDLMAASLVLPCLVGSKVVGIIVLGEKVSKRTFSSEELTILSVLSGQAGMSISHALYVESLAGVQERLIESEKMATIGFLVGGLAHQLKNRFTSLIFFSDFASRKVSHHRGVVFPEPQCDETLSYLGKITDGVHSSKEVVNGVLNYASDRQVKGEISIKKLLMATLELIEFKIPSGSVIFENKITDDAPLVQGNFAQLQEVFFNIIDNAYYAMMEKKNAGAEDGYEPRMSFSALSAGKMLRITIADNGMGIRPENMRKLFTPLFSTKKADKKGHGLGLYVMRQIIEKNHGGRIVFSSDHTKGVKIDMYLPAVPVEQFA